MIDIFHPNDMSVEEIQMEVATLLARGYLRYRRRNVAEDVQHTGTIVEACPLTEKQLDFPGHRSPNAQAG